SYSYLPYVSVCVTPFYTPDDSPDDSFIVSLLEFPEVSVSLAVSVVRLSSFRLREISFSLAVVIFRLSKFKLTVFCGRSERAERLSVSVRPSAVCLLDCLEFSSFLLLVFCFD